MNVVAETTGADSFVESKSMDPVSCSPWTGIGPSRPSASLIVLFFHCIGKRAPRYFGLLVLSSRNRREFVFLDIRSLGQSHRVFRFPVLCSCRRIRKNNLKEHSLVSTGPDCSLNVERRRVWIRIGILMANRTGIRMLLKAQWRLPLGVWEPPAPKPRTGVSR